MCGSDIFLGLIAILFPPLAVWVKRGICSADSIINIALCCLGFLPGLLHAWYIISITPDPTYEPLDPERDGGSGGGAVVTYYYVQQGEPRHGHSTRSQYHHHPRGYGTVNNPCSPDQQFPGSQQGFVGHPQGQAGPSTGANDEVPPTYAEVVSGDHKVQGP
ncbi:hypothetical protein M433DRAFT_4069 [Acidomyces richmondensis BFW]|nr:MAG: hypothetical protein FE78DRAFT_39547 [Acidomyces sp. 'richmondensis']KYG46040.1 hypothetical protein M433DRAFT_4069 [Acidomyces richmondensis BFW]